MTSWQHQRFFTSICCLMLLNACLKKPVPVASDISSIDPILPADRLAKIKSAAPKIMFPKLQAILDDPRTFWYDKSVLEGAYQDTVEPSVAVGCRLNRTGHDSILPTIYQKIFFNGDLWAFPFGQTAGTDFADNLAVAHFLWLPEKDSKTLPVTYWIDKFASGSYNILRWNWMYPVGTVLGELVMIEDPEDKSWTPTELRIRTRYKSAWSGNIYRPFPTSQSLVDALVTERPNWQSDPELSTFISHLNNQDNLVSRTRSSEMFKTVFSQKGFLDFLPRFSDKALIKKLLRETTYTSAYGEKWKHGKNGRAFAASTKENFSFVPKNFEMGIIEVTDASCKRCHQDAGRPIAQFSREPILYGDIWGQDQIFSFHIWNPVKMELQPDGVMKFGLSKDNREPNPEFVKRGLVAPYDRSVHPDQFYSRARPNYEPTY